MKTVFFGHPTHTHTRRKPTQCILIRHSRAHAQHRSPTPISPPQAHGLVGTHSHTPVRSPLPHSRCLFPSTRMPNPPRPLPPSAPFVSCVQSSAADTHAALHRPTHIHTAFAPPPPPSTPSSQLYPHTTSATPRSSISTPTPTTSQPHRCWASALASWRPWWQSWSWWPSWWDGDVGHGRGAVGTGLVSCRTIGSRGALAFAHSRTRMFRLIE